MLTSSTSAVLCVCRLAAASHSDDESNVSRRLRRAALLLFELLLTTQFTEFGTIGLTLATQLQCLLAELLVAWLLLGGRVGAARCLGPGTTFGQLPLLAQLVLFQLTLLAHLLHLGPHLALQPLLLLASFAVFVGLLGLTACFVLATEHGRRGVNIHRRTARCLFLRIVAHSCGTGRSGRLCLRLGLCWPIHHHHGCLERDLVVLFAEGRVHARLRCQIGNSRIAHVRKKCEFFFFFFFFNC
mmetsp:Transcript_2052/g.6473  ORF Transcript_2052/g.6473 Transcript_2052/m.6473 type:complete len:242 (-) Transcript_2052:1934-2659(-)